MKNKVEVRATAKYSFRSLEFNFQKFKNAVIISWQLHSYLSASPKTSNLNLTNDT